MTLDMNWDLVITPPTPTPPNITVRGMTTWAHQRIEAVMVLFPELRDAPLKFRHSPKLLCALAVHAPGCITFAKPDPSFHVIAHEITHEVQDRRLGVPFGERSCDLYTIARSIMFTDESPSYLNTPHTGQVNLWEFLRNEAVLLAREAITRRGKGERNYIVWWEREMLKIAKQKFPQDAPNITIGIAWQKKLAHELEVTV
jgi:hypothetical protein